MSEITLLAGKPGCQTENYRFQEKAGKPSWEAITKHEAAFLVIFDTTRRFSGDFHGPVEISAYMETYVKYFDGNWYVGDSADQIDMLTACHTANISNFQMCILGMVLTYNEQNGYLTMTEENFNVSKEHFPGLKKFLMDSLIGHAEWPTSNLFQLGKVVGYLPCNVKWSNALRFDPSNKEGKCLHFTAASQGTVFVIFASVPDDEDSWYYVQISPYGVGIFKVKHSLMLRMNVRDNWQHFLSLKYSLKHFLLVKTYTALTIQKTLL